MKQNRTLSAKEILYLEYGYSKNFITPHKLHIGKINKYVAYELSEGEPLFTSSALYGVSLVRYNPNTKSTLRLEISQVFIVVQAL